MWSWQADNLQARTGSGTLTRFGRVDVPSTCKGAFLLPIDCDQRSARRSGEGRAGIATNRRPRPARSGHRSVRPDEWHDDSGNWYRSYGNENWEFDENGLMRKRYACISDAPIRESDRKYHWPLGRRPDEHPGLSDLHF